MFSLVPRRAIPFERVSSRRAMSSPFATSRYSSAEWPCLNCHNPNPEERQQPDYKNPSRSIKPECFVAIGFRRVDLSRWRSRPSRAKLGPGYRVRRTGTPSDPLSSNVPRSPRKLAFGFRATAPLARLACTLCLYVAPEHEGKAHSQVATNHGTGSQRAPIRVALISERRL